VPVALDANNHWAMLAEVRHARQRESVPAVSSRQRGAIALLVGLMHVLIIIAARSHGEPPVAAHDAIEVIFLEALPTLPEPPAQPSLPPPLPRSAVEPRAAPGPTRDVSVTAPANVDPPTLTGTHESAALADTAPTLRLFRDDGAIEIPAAVLDDLEAVLSDERQFDYRRAGLDDARRLFGRAPAIEVVSTRFAAGWIEQTDLGTSALESAFKAVTVEVKLGRSMSCVASLFGVVACSWGRIGYVAQLDDPTTLDIDEAAQCDALWSRIVDATEQLEWRSLRDEYESTCRKPLAAGTLPPRR
jgi:hypothetical protein